MNKSFLTNTNTKLKETISNYKKLFSKTYKEPFLKLSKRKEFWKLQRYSLYCFFNFIFKFVIPALVFGFIFNQTMETDQKILIEIVKYFFQLSFVMLIIFTLFSGTIKGSLTVRILKIYALILLTYLFRNITEPMLTYLFLSSGVAFILTVILKKLIIRDICKKIQNNGIDGSNHHYELNIDFGKYDGIFKIIYFKLSGHYCEYKEIDIDTNEQVYKKRYSNCYSLVIKPYFNLKTIELDITNLNRLKEKAFLKKSIESEKKKEGDFKC